MNEYDKIDPREQYLKEPTPQDLDELQIKAVEGSSFLKDATKEIINFFLEKLG